MSRYEQKVSSKNTVIFVILVIAILVLLAYRYFSADQTNNTIETSQIDIPSVANGLKIEQSQEAVDNIYKMASDNNKQYDGSENIKKALIKQINPEDGDSDEIFRIMLANVSDNFQEWFGFKDISRKYIVLINDIAQNQLLYKHRSFLQPSKKFRAEKDSKGIYLGQKSYERYDTLATAINSIDPKKGVELYLTFKPLFEKVFKEFSYPPEYQLEDIFLKAAASVIDAPIIEERVGLVKHSIRYKYSNAQLESLNDVQKMMVRMGPSNTQKIQDKMRELIVELILVS